MFEWIANNYGTIIIAVILAAVIALVIVFMVKDKKKGKTSCGCGCANCAMAGTCHSKTGKAN